MLDDMEEEITAFGFGPCSRIKEDRVTMTSPGLIGATRWRVKRIDPVPGFDILPLLSPRTAKRVELFRGLLGKEEK